MRCPGFALIVASLVIAGGALCTASRAEDAAKGGEDSPVRTLLSVGPQGKGNAAAAAAWKEITAKGPEQLPELLAALDEAKPLAANWIRGAIDAIAGKAVREKRELPRKEIEAFVLDRSHAPRARRLAFEWLARVDDTAADRLIPGMLNDPSTEFRRDAVDRLLDEAKAIPAKDSLAKIRTFRQALTGARDKDQVATIAEALKKLGEPVDLPAHFGFITRWQVIGPFDNRDKRGFDVAYPPEKEINLSAKYPGKKGTVSWRDHSTDDDYGMVDMNKAIAKHMGAAGYAYAVLISKQEQTVDLRLNSLCAVKLWLNGKLLASHEVYHAGSNDGFDRYINRVTLRPGKNTILVKCLQNEQEDSWAQNWDFQLRVCDATGTAIAAAKR